MDSGTFLLAVIVGGVILFFWSGLTQNLLPWGVKSVREPSQPDGLGSIASETQNGMLYTTKQVAAFIAVRPASYYSIRRYFAIEFVTQVLVSVVLSSLLVITVSLAMEQRLMAIFLAAAASVFSVDGQYWNWWGFSNIYTIGVAVNRIAGYLITGWVLVTFILK